MDANDLSPTEWEGLSHDDHMMLLTFGSLNPSLAAFTHSIFLLSPASVGIVLGVVGAKGGIWGDQPLVDAQGERHIPPWEPSPEDFLLWEVPANQSEIEKGKIWKLEQFTMLIDSRTPLNMLAETYLFDPDGKGFLEFTEQVSAWLERLRWALIPLGDDVDYAIFVTSRDCAGWVEEVERQLHENGEVAFGLRPGKGRFHWDEPMGELGS